MLYITWLNILEKGTLLISKACIYKLILIYLDVPTSKSAAYSMMK